MKKDMKTYLILTIIVIAIVIIIIILTTKNPTTQTDKELVQCIGQNSELYVQLGCHACEIQEALFGDNYNYLNIIDCVFESEKCAQAQITATPTWIINQEKIKNVQSIETLKQLTGC